jgi:hypothetical protein
MDGRHPVPFAVTMCADGCLVNLKALLFASECFHS